MDLEIMNIIVNESDYNMKKVINPKYYRTIVRKTDIAGKFKRL